ncbi:hypothetical protein SLEP1_g39501 [Rubroshorea leprosula]|uniref:Uncharacterized protein n=1 Tax=Rubroshorea leprosula TaxID=152421 RepID=A0AAV5L177_9ROSI|nr:hypothetical protein SLEP1_g39501 [Rubroshorea leprosula]
MMTLYRLQILIEEICGFFRLNWTVCRQDPRIIYGKANGEQSRQEAGVGIDSSG